MTTSQDKSKFHFFLHFLGNLKVTGFDQDKFKGTTFGPFIGPTVIGTIPGRNEWESMYVLATKKDASRYLRVCEEKNLRQVRNN